MEDRDLLKTFRALSEPFGIVSGKRFALEDIDPADTLGFKPGDKRKAQAALRAGVTALASLQDRLYASNRWAVLLIFQAMDAAGKDSAIKHVMSGVNPQGCRVHSFKAPSAEEWDHDFLWRCVKRLPERGRIGIFNRSYYEETLVVRVHPEYLEKQNLPPSLVTPRIWKERFEDIRHFERYLARNGVLILKFFLHLSPGEQKRRFLKRLKKPDKHWKFSSADLAERAHWDRYMRAYEDMVRATAAPEAPWYVVPADHKWFTRMVVAAAVVSALASLGLEYPVVGAERRKRHAEARRMLEREDASGGKKGRA